METPHSSEVAPPGIPLTLQRPTEIADIPGDEALALADCDGTLTKKKKKLLIQSFFEQYRFGTKKTRKDLKDIFEAEAAAKKAGIETDYEQFLTDTGDEWAEMLCSQGITRPELMDITGRWYRKKGKKLIANYAPGVIETLKGRHFRPVMVTGAPYEIVAHFAADLGIDYVFSMEAEVDKKGRYTGEILHNTGLGRAKGKICELLQAARHKILFAMGDTHSDMDLMRPAIGYNGRHDGPGRAIMINPRPETVKGLKMWCRGDLSNNKLVVIEQHDSQKAVQEQVDDMLRHILRDNAMTSGQIDMAA